MFTIPAGQAVWLCFHFGWLKYVNSPTGGSRYNPLGATRPPGSTRTGAGPIDATEKQINQAIINTEHKYEKKLHNSLLLINGYGFTISFKEQKLFSFSMHYIIDKTKKYCINLHSFDSYQLFYLKH